MVVDVPKVALRVTVADPLAVKPSAVSIVDGSDGAETVRLWFFAGFPRRIVLPVTLDAASAERLRAYQRKVITLLSLGGLVLLATLWRLVHVVTAFAGGADIGTGGGAILLIPILVLLIGSRILGRARPAFFPVPVPGSRSVVVLRGLDPAGADDWKQRNPGLIEQI
ncbi:hypothetical protein F4553_006352 [Allocatelliglobosispora scoriae]|uniref:Uncharacterized protein n=1 Tax=Allocatelliglobosispora scoriae TaxID=643052 RepID=A0A841BZJ5_9ACTN|nr:hypothetical protein [Allocatelliglobosispora scoriae]MBB5872918.1 hypothetical protein [Allocatelliglobosispora scoriae]